MHGVLYLQRGAPSWLTSGRTILLWILGVPDSMYEMDDFCPQGVDLETWRTVVEVFAVAVSEVADVP